MRSNLVFALALSAMACSPSGQEGHGPRASHSKSQLRPEERRDSALTARWLVGYWDHNRECRSGAGTSLWPDGSYTMNDASGRWSLSGNVLTAVQKKAPSVAIFQVRLGDAGRSRIEVVGPTTIFVGWEGGGTSLFYLCDPR